MKNPLKIKWVRWMIQLIIAAIIAIGGWFFGYNNGYNVEIINCQKQIAEINSRNNTFHNTTVCSGNGDCTGLDNKLEIH